MRLIDADNLENFAYEECFWTEEMIYDWIREVGFDEETLEKTEDKLKELCWKVLAGCMNVIRTEPTAYDVENIVKVLENVRDTILGPRYKNAALNRGNIDCLFNQTIKLVKSGGVDNGN